MLSRPARAMASEDLAYRPCVGIMVLNRDGPGVDRPAPRCARRAGGPGRLVADAAGRHRRRARTRPRRRCASSTRRPASARSPSWPRARSWYTYDLPEHLRPKAWGGRYRGQKQKWFAVRFLGADEEVAIARPGHTPGVRRLALGRHRRAAGPDRAVQARRLRAGGARLRATSPGRRADDLPTAAALQARPAPSCSLA